MTFKDLARLVNNNLAMNRNSGYQHALTSHVSSTQPECLTEQFCLKQFWIWVDIIKHRTLYIQTKWKCGFNHITKLPRNNQTMEENPLFDYQQIVFDAQESHRHLFILKAT